MHVCMSFCLHFLGIWPLFWPYLRAAQIGIRPSIACCSMLTLCVDCILGLSCVVACVSGITLGMHLMLSRLAYLHVLYLTCCHMIEWSHTLVCMLVLASCNMLVALVALLFVCMFIWHARLACLGCILHAFLASWLTMIEVRILWVFGVHYIWYQIAQLDIFGHHVLKCVIDGPRAEYQAPFSHEYDKECGWCKHCLKCIAMPCFALCCCQNRFLLTNMAGRLHRVPIDQI